MKAKHQSYWFVIPSEVWDAEITARAMILYGHISVLANKNKYCYASNAYFEKVMKSSSSSIGRSMKELEEAGLISREMVYKEGSKSIDERKIYLNIGIVKTDDRPIVKNGDSPIVTGDEDINTSKNTTSINTIDAATSFDDLRKKLYWERLLPGYPTNRVGNRQHILKKWMKLTDQEMGLAIKNKERYLKLAGAYVKSLSNYIDERCFTEEWLDAETKRQTSIQTKNTGLTTKTFKSNYEDC